MFRLLTAICRASTGGTLFPTVELVDPVGCSQGVKGYHLYSPLHLHRDNLPGIHPLNSPVQISINTDREERHLILRFLHTHSLPLAPRHILPHVRPHLRWRHLDPSLLPGTILHTSGLIPTRLVPQVRVLRPVMATRLIQQPVHHLTLQLPLYPLWTNYWR